VNFAVGGQDAAVPAQRFSGREIKFFSFNITDLASGLFDDQAAGGVIPDFFAIIGGGRLGMRR